VEIAPVPHPTPAISRGRVLGTLLVIGPVIVLVFLPTVLGLQRHVVADRAMEGTAEGSIGRGSVALTRAVPSADLAVGDVIVLRPPVEDGTSAGGSVTRRIVAIKDGVARTRGDNLQVDDPWRLDVSTSTYPRVEFVLPWVGYPFAGQAGQGGWVLLAAAIGVALVLAAAVQWRQRRTRVVPGWRPRGGRRDLLFEHGPESRHRRG
jgi:signal peptidase I